MKEKPIPKMHDGHVMAVTEQNKLVVYLKWDYECKNCFRDFKPKKDGKFSERYICQTCRDAAEKRRNS